MSTLPLHLGEVVKPPKIRNPPSKYKAPPGTWFGPNLNPRGALYLGVIWGLGATLMRSSWQWVIGARAWGQWRNGGIAGEDLRGLAPVGPKMVGL